MEVKEEYLKVFFQKNTGYYIEKWQLFNQGARLGAKPYAFLFGGFWLFYRKMHREALILLIIIVAESAVENHLLGAFYSRSADAQMTSQAAMTVALSCILGFTGNYLYMRSAKRKISRILNKYTVEEEILQKLRRTGGTSFMFLYVWVAIVLLCLLLLRISGE